MATTSGSPIIGNIEELDSNSYRVLDGNRTLKALLTSFYIFHLSLGSLLHVGFYSFEKYSGDPKKRGLSNQLASQLSMMTVFFFGTTIPIEAYAFFVGSLNSDGFIYYLTFSYQFRFFRNTLSMLEIALIKFMTIVVFKQVLPLEEDFFACFLFLANITVGFVFGLVYTLTSEVSGFRMELKGLTRFTAPFSPIDTGYVDFTFAFQVILLTFLYCMIYWQKKACNTQVGVESISLNTINNNNFGELCQMNTTPKNKDVVSVGIYVVLGILATVLMCCLLAFKHSGMLFIRLLDCFVGMLAVPLLLYAPNAELRDFTKGLILKQFDDDA